jgi:hypothetical protein
MWPVKPPNLTGHPDGGKVKNRLEDELARER